MIFLVSGDLAWELHRVESVQLEIKLTKLFFLVRIFHGYQIQIEGHNKIERSIDQEFGTYIRYIIIICYFNYNYLDISGRKKITSLFNEHDMI